MYPKSEPCTIFWASNVVPDQALGQALRSLRTKRELTQAELALQSRVVRNQISLIELGRSSPSVRTLFQLCDALDVAPSELLKDVERRMQVISQGGDPTIG